MPRALRRQYLPKRPKAPARPALARRVDDFIPTLVKPTTFKKLSSDVIAKIVHKVVEDKWSYREVGIKFRVTASVVGTIIKRIKLDGAYVN